MQEKRRDKRTKVTLNLEISSLFKQDNVKVEMADTPIQVVDISRSGIGFQSESSLPLGYYFNACIQLGQEDAKLYCVVKIIRSLRIDDKKYMYGCEFVGMAPVLSYIFDSFESAMSESESMN
ncbi:MAG: PilZ domain-containing protein [Clostridiales bacterium]|nr:PilZ domain-containing protein [Clostridiales bacterium]